MLSPSASTDVSPSESDFLLDIYSRIPLSDSGIISSYCFCFSLFFLPPRFVVLAFLCDCSWITWMSRLGSLFLEFITLSVCPLPAPLVWIPPVLLESAELFFYWCELLNSGMLALFLFTILSMDAGAGWWLLALAPAFCKDRSDGLVLMGFIFVLFKLLLLIELKLEPRPLDPCVLSQSALPFSLFSSPN